MGDAGTILFVFAAGAAALLVAEIAARLAIRRGGVDFVWRPGSRLRMHVDQSVLASQGPTVQFDINRDGERGDDPPAESEGTYRILTAGGSAVECYFLDQPDSWPEVMKRGLSKPEALAALSAARVHVGNIGKSLIGTEFIDQIFERIFPRYRKLDCIVFMVGASNVVNWITKKAPALIEERPPCRGPRTGRCCDANGLRSRRNDGCGRGRR